MHFGVSTLSLEHCSTGKRKMETDCQCKGPLWAGLRPQPFSLSQCSGAHTLLSKDYLWSIHHPSTCNQLMEPLTISPTVKKREKGAREEEEKNANLLSYHRRHWNYVLFHRDQPLFLSAWVRQWVWVWGRGGVWVWGDTRTRTFEKPFHTAWSGDMDPMRQRRGTRYFKVT